MTTQNVVVVLNDTCQFGLPLLSSHADKCYHFLKHNRIDLGCDYQFQAKDIYFNTVVTNQLGEPLVIIPNKLDFIERDIMGHEFEFEFIGRSDSYIYMKRYGNIPEGTKIYKIVSMIECNEQKHQNAILPKNEWKNAVQKFKEVAINKLKSKNQFEADFICEKCGLVNHGENVNENGIINGDYYSVADEAEFKFVLDPGYKKICSICCIDYLTDYQLFLVCNDTHYGDQAAVEYINPTTSQHETLLMPFCERYENAFETQPPFTRT
jgi:hypothetical protein